MPSPTPTGDELVRRVLEVVADIPPGSTMSYGQVAAACGSRAPRSVGRIMRLYGSDVPWWRVVSASGHPTGPHAAEAEARLREENAPPARPRAR